MALDVCDPNWVLLAELDESADYEVDITEIHYDIKQKDFILLTASGCSCWAGDYGEERFQTLAEIETSLLKDERQYNPSFVGAKNLVEEARRVYTAKYRPEYIEVNGVYIKTAYN